MKNKVIVLGSINADTTLHVKKIPLPGETVPAYSMTSAAGGKGANQAIATIRSGAKVSFFGSIGNDAAGKNILKVFEAEGIDTSMIHTSSKSNTGAATILLDEQGQNSILVYAGANFDISKEQILGYKERFEEADMVIAQFETPISATKQAFKIAKDAGKLTILNPAPAKECDEELISLTDVIIPNETECASITGFEVKSKEDMDKAAEYFSTRGVRATLITLGERGVYYSVDGDSAIIPGFKVNAKDTTAAGDTFIGSMASKLDKKFSNLKAAIIYGQQASSITVQRMGAIPSIPTQEEIEKVYGEE